MPGPPWPLESSGLGFLLRLEIGGSGGKRTSAAESVWLSLRNRRGELSNQRHAWTDLQYQFHGSQHRFVTFLLQVARRAEFARRTNWPTRLAGKVRRR